MKPKGRPQKIRFVEKMPKIYQFSPRGRPGRPEEIELSADQLEALRLADYLNFDQAKGAAVLGVSRASFGRILRQTRKLVADALANGKIIRISKSKPNIFLSKSIPDHSSNSPKNAA